MLMLLAAWAQPRYDYSKLRMEQLDRGVVAIRQTDGRVFVSWRTLRSDRKAEPFNIYRNGLLLNATPLTEGGTCFIDEAPTADDAVYRVEGGERNGEFTLRSDAPVGYLPISINKPEGGTSPDGWPYDYTANDCSVGDVDGDGQYEIIVKWDPTNSHDNTHDGFTGPTLFDCYRLNGHHLWRIDMGRNIRSGAHYVPFIVYDLDGDGCAELMVKTADGTRDAKGNIIGDATADYRYGADTPQKRLPKRGRILEGQSTSACSAHSRAKCSTPSPTSPNAATCQTGVTTAATALSAIWLPWAISTASMPAPSSAAATTRAPCWPHGTGTDTS